MVIPIVAIRICDVTIPRGSIGAIGRSLWSCGICGPRCIPWAFRLERLDPVMGSCDYWPTVSEVGGVVDSTATTGSGWVAGCSGAGLAAFLAVESGSTSTWLM